MPINFNGNIVLLRVLLNLIGNAIKLIKEGHIVSGDYKDGNLFIN